MPNNRRHNSTGDQSKALSRFVKHRKRFSSQGVSPLTTEMSRPNAALHYVCKCALDKRRLLSIDEGGGQSSSMATSNARGSYKCFCGDKKNRGQKNGTPQSPEPVASLLKMAKEACSNRAAKKSPQTSLAKVKSQIERYRQFLCSPSMFNVCNSPTALSTLSPTFKWSPEQLAIMKPVDFDETDLREFESPLDSRAELLVQQAITDFFANNVIVPSPELNCLERSPANMADLREVYQSPWKQFGLQDKRRSVACQTIFSFSKGFNFVLFFGPTMFRLNDDKLAVCGLEQCDDQSSFGHSSEFELLSPLCVPEENSLLKRSKKATRVKLRRNQDAAVEDTALFDSSPKAIGDQKKSNKVDEHALQSSASLKLTPFKPRRIDFEENAKDEQKTKEHKKDEGEKKGYVRCTISFPADEATGYRKSFAIENPLQTKEFLESILHGFCKPSS